MRCSEEENTQNVDEDRHGTGDLRRHIVIKHVHLMWRDMRTHMTEPKKTTPIRQLTAIFFRPGVAVVEHVAVKN